MKTLAMYAFVVASVMAATSCSHGSKDADAAAEKMTVDVAFPVEDSVVLRKSYPGYLSADHEIQLVARVDGYLQSQNYTSGDFVRKGTVLFKIEDSNYRDAVSKAQAALATAQSQNEYAASRYAAMTEAFKADAVSEMEVIQARSNLEQSEADIKTARASLQTAQTQLSYCTVIAPCDGHMSNSPYTAGSYLSGAGSPVVLASIYDDAKVTANFNIEDATYLTALREAIADNKVDFENIPVTFTDSLEHQYTASLIYKDPHISTSTGTMLFQASIKNTYGELRSGMFVVMEIPYDIESEAILVKDASICTDQLGKYLYVLNDSNKIVYTPIEVGQTYQDTLRIVTKGITAKDRYVTKALLKVRDGMTVNPRIVK